MQLQCSLMTVCS